MKSDEEPGRENEARREQIARLGAAILRIVESLELDCGFRFI